MTTILVRVFGLIIFTASIASAQDVIPLYTGTPPGSVPENNSEKEYFSKLWDAQVVANVSRPSLTLFKPAPEQKNGTAIVICPGGGLVAIEINNEGTDEAKYLAARGITAFVLKYRIIHTEGDPTEAMVTLSKDREKFQELQAKALPLAISDALAAVAYVRQHASEWGIASDRVGLMGFSAGATITAGAAFQYTPESRPAFLAPIYGSAKRFKDAAVPADAPPLFLAAATDDQFGLAAESAAMYERWTAAHKSAELHLYAKGGHGFGMHQQNLPTDHWIDRFVEWLNLQGRLKK